MCLHRACMCHTIYIYTYMSDKLVSNSHEHCQLCKANGFWAPEQKKKRRRTFKYADKHIAARKEQMNNEQQQ